MLAVTAIPGDCIDRGWKYVGYVPSAELGCPGPPGRRRLACRHGGSDGHSFPLCNRGGGIPAMQLG